MFDFSANRKWFFILSALMVVPGAISLLLFGLRPGIEFQSGSLMTLHFAQEVEQSAIRDELGKIGFGDAIIQHTAEGDWLVRTRELKGVNTTEQADQSAGESERVQILQALCIRFKPAGSDAD